MKKFWRWLRSPFRVHVLGTAQMPDVAGVCSYRGGALIAMSNGIIYQIDDDAMEGFPKVREIARLRSH